MERWRIPLRISAVEPDLLGVMTIAGRRYSNVDVTLEDDDDFDRLCEGYVCAQCFEPQEQAFPKACGVCGFKMRDEQTERLGLAFKGEKWIGPRESNDDELLRMMEENERRKHNKDSSIVLPRGVD